MYSSTTTKVPPDCSLDQIIKLITASLHFTLFSKLNVLEILI